MRGRTPMAFNDGTDAGLLSPFHGSLVSMQGYVLSIRPISGEATIITDSGETYRYTNPEITEHLSGGDRVVLDRLADTSTDYGAKVRLVESVVDRLQRDHAAELREFAELLANRL